MPKDEKEKQEEEIKVTDKRRFTEEGEVRDEVEDKAKVEAEAKGEAKVEDKAKSEDKAQRGEKGAIPEINFATFVLSLATSAQVHLGLLANPATGKQEKDLALAKQTIDILGILQDKTKGNLTDEENKLLEQILYELRMVFVQKKEN